MNQISAKLAELLLGSGDHTGNLGPLVGQRRHDVTFRHIHPRSQNDRADCLLQVDMMSAMRLVCMRHDTAILRGWDFTPMCVIDVGFPTHTETFPDTPWVDTRGHSPRRRATL